MSLEKLYQEIKNCHICPLMDKYKTLRLIEAVNIKSDVFIISQSLAESQLRLSGINFFNKEGVLGNTGTNLEIFLNKFKRTVHPNHPIYTPVYNTEITQCFPGKTKKGDRIPTLLEIKTCINQKFLLQEIEIIKPKLILLMGKLSYENFFNHILLEKPKVNLTEYINSLTSIPIFNVNGTIVHVLPIQHASGANPRFNKMTKNELLIEKIIRTLEQPS